ncbi:MAG: replicative DNA helicase [Planctomycetota bacterium]|jgi:replicative DNA helicase
MSTDSLLDRVPPQDIEAEAAVLGSIILDNECAGEIVQVLNSESFYRRSHAVIYESLINLYDARRAIDLVTLRDELERRGLLEDAGGVEHLAELAESVPSAANAEEYARIVREKAILRSLIAACTGIVRDAYEARDDVEVILDRTEKQIFEVAESRVGRDIDPLLEVLKRTMEKIDRYQGRKGQYTGAPSGYTDLDELTGGFQSAEMVIIAARPSMGKTTLALNIMKNVALEHALPVAIFSMEMSEQTIAQNLLCIQAGVDAHKLRSGFLSGKDWDAIGRALGELSEAPVYIDDSPGLTILQLRAKARRLALRRGIKMMMVDYIQLMTSPGQESRQQEIADISRGLKALARELDIPVIVLSQLNRSPEAREGHRPRLGDLRESGALEQDADVVLLIHRPGYYQGSADDQTASPARGERTELIIAKQRNGPTGAVPLTFLANVLQFKSCESRFEDSVVF